MQTITCSCYPKLDIRVDARHGAGTIVSNLQQVIGLPQEIQTAEDRDDRQYMLGAADALESFLLTLAAEGVDVAQPAFGSALATFLDAIGNHLA